LEPASAERAGRAPPAGEPPVVNITSPIDGAEVNGTVEITGFASDPDGSVESVTVRIEDGQWLGAHMAAAAALWNLSWNTSAVPDGLHTIFARAYDGFLYSSQVAISIIVRNTIPGPPPSKPAVSVVNVSNTSAVLSWNASTDVGFTSYKVQKSPNNSTWTDVASLFDQNVTVYEAGNLTPNSSVHFRVETTVIGGASSISDPITVDIPEKQEPQDSPPGVLSFIYYSASINPGNKTFILTAFDLFGYITAYNISWGDGNVTGFTPLPHGPAYSIATEMLNHTYGAATPFSHYLVIVSVKDDAGGVGFYNTQVYVDPQPPPQDGHLFLSAENLSQGQTVFATVHYDSTIWGYYEFMFDFGDGTNRSWEYHNPAANHSYNKPGTFNITLRCRNWWGVESVPLVKVVHVPSVKVASPEKPVPAGGVSMILIAMTVAVVIIALMKKR
jgi:hypothetical protein